MLGNMCMMVGHDAEHDAEPKNEKIFKFFEFFIFSTF